MVIWGSRWRKLLRLRFLRLRTRRRQAHRHLHLRQHRLGPRLSRRLRHPNKAGLANRAGDTAFGFGVAESSGCLCLDAVLPMGGDEPDDAGDEDEFDRQVEAMEDGLEARV